MLFFHNTIKLLIVSDYFLMNLNKLNISLRSLYLSIDNTNIIKQILPMSKKIVL